MRTRKTAAAACLLAATALVLAGCSGSKKRASDKSTEDVEALSGTRPSFTVEVKVTGDSPASVYVPGVLGESGVRSQDLDEEHLKTPWSKKFTASKGDLINMQAAAEDPTSHISCQVLVDGKVKKQRTAKARKKTKGGPLVSYCYTTV